MPRVIDLFAGLGGIRLGFTEGFEDEGLEVECVFSSELKPYAIKAYKGYFGNEDVHGDITKIPTSDIPDFDFLLAGFPCQPFSSAGMRKGFLDTRGTLFFEIERILRDKMDEGHPAQGFLLENVEGLINHEGGDTLRTIIEHLEAMGYNVEYRLLDAQDFGLAQSRKRVYITGLLNGRANLDEFDENHSMLGDILQVGLPTRDSKFTRNLLRNYSLDELPGKAIKDKRGGSDNIHSWDIDLKGRTTKEERKLLNALLKERRKKHWAEEIGIKWMDGMPLTEEQIRTFYDNKNLHSMLEKLTKLGYLTFEHPKKQIRNEDGALVRVPDEKLPCGYNIVAGKLSFEFSKILDSNELAPTLVAMDVSKLGVVDGEGIRPLSIRECQRLCGYPEDYDLDMVTDSEAFDLLGNTVCVPVIRKVANRMAQAFIGE